MARKYARIFVRGHYLFREANSFPRAKLEENCELRGTDNVQGQISVHIFESKWMLLCLLSFKYFFYKAAFWKTFLNAKEILSALKILLGCSKCLAKRANVNRKVRKLGNITWGISSDIPQFWLHHVTCLDQSRARKIFDGL